MGNTKKNIAVIGNGTMTLSCVQHMLAHDDCDIKVFLTYSDEISPNLEKRIRKFCETKTIHYIHANNLHSEKLLKTLEKLELDYIFNIDSFSIIREALLTLPKYGIINFHNSYLPFYRGANAPSWAIINDDKEFGVTWHFMDDGIDTGAILWQTKYEISPNETARTLIFKSIEAGIKLFKQHFHELLEDEPKTTLQPEEGSRYFRRDKPNDGYINFSWPVRKIDCMVRGLDYRPFENPFIRAKVRLENSEYFVNKIKILSVDNKVKNITAGKILSVSSKGIEITAADGVILIEDMCAIDSNETIDFMSVNVNY